MSGKAGLFWWILRAQISTPLKLTLFAMALHGDGLDNIYPGLARVGHFRSRTQRMIRQHVGELVTMGLLIPRSSGKGGHQEPTRYSIGIVALDRYIDRSMEPPAAIPSPRLLKVILFADLKPHQQLLLWALSMYDGHEVTKEQLARTLFRSTQRDSLEQLRRDVGKLADAGLVTRTARSGRNGGMTCVVNFEQLTKCQMPAPPRNHGYQLPGTAPLPFATTTGTDRTETTGTDRTETTGTNFLRSGTTTVSGDFPRTGTYRKNLSEVIDGQQRPVHAAENSGPSSPLPSHKNSRSTGAWRAGRLIYDQLRSWCYQQIKLAVDEGRFERSELDEALKSWCAQQRIDRFALPGRRPESSKDITARVVDDALFLFEQHHGPLLDRPKSGSGGGTREF